MQQPSPALDRLASTTMHNGDRWSELAEERDRIARELHDIVVQRLFLVGLLLAKSASFQPQDVELSEILDDIDRSITDLRAVIFGLQRPRAITGVASRRDEFIELEHRTDDVTNATAPTEADRHVDGDAECGADGDGDAVGVARHLISRVVADLVDLIGHRPHLEIDGDIESIDDEVLTECAVVVRELLINALKHAHGSQTWVSLTVDDGWVTIMVEDDGDGVRTLHPAQGGTGLRSLSERARHNGGGFHVEPRTPRGTRVRWSVPVG